MEKENEQMEESRREGKNIQKKDRGKRSVKKKMDILIIRKD